MGWMDHLNYLPLVVEEDLRCIHEKEATYQGSWKKSGGRSAWFMLRRKIDRMLEMLKKPEPPGGFNIINVQDTIESLSKGSSLPGTPEATKAILDHLLAVYKSEDIFLKVEEDPSGDDGSVLAEIRDLRRYLTLVEAEMISRGVVANPVPSGEFRMKMEDWGKDPAKSIKPEDIFDDPLNGDLMEIINVRTIKDDPDGNVICVIQPMTRLEAIKRGVIIVPGTPEDGGHHAKQEDRLPGDANIEEQILAAQQAQRAAKDKHGFPVRDREGEDQ